MWTTHLHHGVPGAVVSQVLQPGDEALAGLTVDAARLHHGLALFHELGDSELTGSIKTFIEIFRESREGTETPSNPNGIFPPRNCRVTAPRGTTAHRSPLCVTI